jgi:hypothetical protein
LTLGLVCVDEDKTVEVCPIKKNLENFLSSIKFHASTIQSYIWCDQRETQKPKKIRKFNKRESILT